jgi:hypothetical protein
MNYYLQNATIKKIYNTSNDNLPLVYGHVYKTLKLNSNISVQTMYFECNCIQFNCFYTF